MRIAQFLAAALLLVGGCGHECTAIGCVQGVTLELAAPLTEGGEYTFTLTTGAETMSCNAFVPLRRDGSEPTCEGMHINRQELTTRAGDAEIGTAGDAIVSVGVGGEHETLTLTVSRDGSQILQADVAPVYRGVEINGEGCGECPMATHRLEQ